MSCTPQVQVHACSLIDACQWGRHAALPGSGRHAVWHTLCTVHPSFKQLACVMVSWMHASHACTLTPVNSHDAPVVTRSCHNCHAGNPVEFFADMRGLRAGVWAQLGSTRPGQQGLALMPLKTRHAETCYGALVAWRGRIILGWTVMPYHTIAYAAHMKRPRASEVM